MTDTRIIMHFTRVQRLLRSAELSVEARTAAVDDEVKHIMAVVPTLPKEDQQDILAALYHFGLLEDRRSGEDRRDKVRDGSDRNWSERRTGKDRRQSRNAARLGLVWE